MATREGYKTMMVALQEYAKVIQDSEKRLMNSANVCCEAMGNDKISTESRAELESCLADLNKIVPQIEELFNMINQEYEDAFNI
jgi:hypothetical protein